MTHGPTTTTTTTTTATLVAFAILGALSHGVPLGDEPTELPPPAPAATATEMEAEIVAAAAAGNPMTEIEPEEPAPPPQPRLSILGFSEAPHHTDTELGASVLLVCKTAEPVAECRWSWQPLPPTHLPLPNTDDSLSQIHANVNELVDAAATTTTTTTTMTTTSTMRMTTALNATTTTTTTTRTVTPTGPSLAVRTFPAFGNTSNDCSVRFASTRYEQTGYWSCAARRSDEETFTSTSPAKLSIVHVDAASSIGFLGREDSVEAPAGSGARLSCRANVQVHECRWTWRQLNQSQSWDAEVRRFPAEGPTCDLGLSTVKPEHEGIWTCGARLHGGTPFVQARPIKLLISEVEFVQLSRDIQITAGETVFLRCLVNKPVYGCEWSWRPNNSSKNSTLLTRFSPVKETDHDCSVRFKNILYEEEGLWTCGVKLTADGILHEAPSTTVALLPSGKVNFTEVPESTSAAVGSGTTLRCATNGRVERCTWTWQPLDNEADPEPTRLREFPGHGDLGRNCSLELTRLRLEDQGHWTCQVYLAGVNALMTSGQIKLSVYEEEEVRFSELSQDIQISSGGTVSLRCVTSARVEQCRWSLSPEGTANTTVVVKLFGPAGAEGRDCSVKLSHALQEQEGLWTCGARLHARQNYTDAPPARLSLIEPEPVTITFWGAPHQMVNLACKTTLLVFQSQCIWSHNLKSLLSDAPKPSRKTKYTVSMNHTSGICRLQFTPDEQDFGEWICEFVVDNPQVQAKLGNASILLLNNSPDQQLSWLVGAITSSVLFLLIAVVVMVVYKTRLCDRRIPAFLETLPPSETKRNMDSDSRQVDRIPAIDLSHTNPKFLLTPDNIRSVLPNRSPRLYDRVGKGGYATPRTNEGIKIM